MTQDEIIEMAKQCGIVVGYPKYQDINAFAKLVAQRTWVGLTPSEIDEIIEDAIDPMDALLQTMDKLKDKNI